MYCRRCSKQKHGSPQRRVSRMHNYVSQEPNQTFQPVRFFSFGCKTTYAVHHYNQKVPTITHFLIFVGGGRCNATWWRKYASSWGLGAPTARSASKKQTEREVSWLLLPSVFRLLAEANSKSTPVIHPMRRRMSDLRFRDPHRLGCAGLHGSHVRRFRVQGRSYHPAAVY